LLIVIASEAWQSHYLDVTLKRIPIYVIMKQGFVYILTNKNNSTLYIGVTSEIVIRIKQHKEKHSPKSFTARYNLNKLVYFEAFQMIGDAIGREKQLKAGSRAKKVTVIESINPEWIDLYEEVIKAFGGLD
jgi:putative endonuclease